MTTKKERESSRATQRAAIAFTRRNLLQASAAGAAIAAAPAFVRDARSSSGEVNVYSWSDYIWPDMIESFEAATGIKVNLAVYGSNDEVQAKLRATGGTGFDLIFPSVDTGEIYYTDASGNLLQPIDESKVNVAGVIPAMWDKSLDLGATFRGERYQVPFDWGTEAMTFNSAHKDYAYGELSWGSLWEDDQMGTMTCRGKSVLVSIALMMDASGEMPTNRLADTITDEGLWRETLDKALSLATEKKAWIRQFWNNTQETLNAFQQNGCTIGQCWDGPSIRMQRESGGEIRYMMPKEGGLAWLDCMAIPSGAENIDQAYAFMNHMLTPEVGGTFANQSGYNSAAVGAADHLSDELKGIFLSAYPGDAIDNLWWWLPAPTWWFDARSEAVDKLIAA